ncbi:ankyrin repeat-containing domain protein [Flagelloscypha sp. PMI_526]|nr:ankyrin repeat-containing domain protein [Flagelloscypha sp. PMI_526]
MTSSQPDIEHGGVGCRDGSFLKRTSWWIRLFFCPMTKLVAERRAARSPEVRQEAPEPSGMSKHSIIKKFSNITHFFNPVLVIGSLHLTMMAGVGIWLWLSPLDFGSSNPSCTAQASFLILNRPISLASRRLQNASLVVYFLFVIPGLNIFLPMLLLGLIYVSFNTSRMYKGTHALTVWPLGFGLVILAVVNAIFILDIERSIKINSSIADSSTEQGWTFGQILPLVLLLIPLRDVVEILTNKRDHERLQDLDTALYNVLDGATGLFDLLDGGAGAPPLRRHGYAFATPLHFAANVDSLRLVKDCLSKYPNHFINDKDHNGMTPIGIAAKKGFTKIVEVLPKVELGAGAGEFGSPFRAALYMGNHDAAAKLQSPSVTGPTGVDNSDLEFFNEFTKNHNDWKIDGGIRGSSLGLRFAAAANDVEMMKVLLKEDADTNLIGPGPNIDQAFALGLASEKGYLGAVELLLENGADVNIGDDCALCSASDNGHPEVMRVLLRHGAYVNINSGSLLISASENGRLEVMRVLLDHGADVNINSGSLLISASKKGRLEVIRVLLEHGADVNKSSSPGGSALSLASENGHQEVVELLLENGADVNIFGASALRLAAFNRHFEVVALLVEKGADVMRFDCAKNYSKQCRCASLEHGTKFPSANTSFTRQDTKVFYTEN